MKKILYSFAVIILVVCIWLFAKPYKIFDFSFAQPSSDKNINVYVGMDKIGVGFNKNKLNFTIINHPDEVNGLYFSKRYEEYWHAKPSKWFEKHGVISAQFYDEFVNIVSEDSKEEVKKCFIDAKEENVITYVCYKANSERVSGVVDDHLKYTKILLSRLKTYNNEIKNMGPINECARSDGYCNR